MVLPAGALFPDIENAVITFLRADPDVDALVGAVDFRVVSPWPCLRVLRVGGSPPEPRRVDEALIQLEAIGEPDEQSSTQRRALSDLLNTAMTTLRWRFVGAVTAGAAVSRLDVVTHLQWAPDQETNQQRYFTRLLVTAFAA